MNDVVVLDNNILVSSIFWEKGHSHKIVDLAIEQKIINFTSPEMLNELSKVLRVKFRLPEDNIERQLALVANYSQIIQPKIKLKVIKEDPKDDKVLECALECNADYIVTGDKRHLLKLQQFKGIRIVTPKQFLDLIRK